jgi:hypothetical protein
MRAPDWRLADLGPDQLELLWAVESTLPGDVVLVFAPTRWGTIDGDVLAAEGLAVDDTLDAMTVEQLQTVEQAVGGIAVAYRLPTATVHP